MRVVEDLMVWGPSRRHPEKTVIELSLVLDDREIKALRAADPPLHLKAIDALSRRGIEPAVEHPLRCAPSGEPADQVAWLLGGVTLALQQHAGHRVDFLSLIPSSRPGGSRVVVEFEDGHAGDAAENLAFSLLAEVAPAIEREAGADPPFDDLLPDFMQLAKASVLPLGTQAIIDAAARLDVPCVKLDRHPYEGVKGPFRVRPHGMLKLGHACHQQVVDGTFCIYRNENLSPLLHDRAAVRTAMQSMGEPLARFIPDAQDCVTSRRAMRAGEKLGFPVVVKPLGLPRSAGDTGLALGLGSAEEVRRAAEQALRSCRAVSVETHIPGSTFKILVANSRLITVMAFENGVAVADRTELADPSLKALALSLAESTGAALVTLTVISRDITQPLESSGAIISMNVAPELDSFLPFQEVVDDAAEELVRFLFPQPGQARIPIITVTGTNGKTTICALIARIMQAEGFVTGRAGTTGFYINDECLQTDDFSGGSGHHKVLETTEVNFAVLESARGAATAMGFMFDWCDIAVCSNVTHDHLFERGINSVQEMADLKCLIMQRARHSVVLNADNEFSAGMLSRLNVPNVWMVSNGLSPAEIREIHGPQINCAVTETIEGRLWIVLYTDRERIPVLPIDEIPITWGGRLSYNISNSLQAAAACFERGAALENIRDALGGFEVDNEANPGRMNFCSEHPFDVLFDYAHNEDAYRHLCRFVETLEVRGRKLISFAMVGRYPDSEIIDLTRKLAGSFDHYICRNYPVIYEREPDEVPEMMKRTLIECGVDESCITKTPGDDYVEEALDLCQPGDLLVFCASTRNLRIELEKIRSYRATD